MAPRAYWKGYLKLSLVSCPIALYPASSSSERVSFNRINKKTGSRLKQQNVDAETGEPVEREDIGRGYEVGKGQYLQVEDDELATMCLSSGFGDLLNTEVYLRAYESVAQARASIRSRRPHSSLARADTTSGLFQPADTPSQARRDYASHVE